MNLPFETVTERALRAVRGLARRVTTLYQMAYETPEGPTVAVAGNESGPYFNALARASDAAGDSDVVVEAGESQRLLSDTDGRIWAVLFADGVPVSTASPLPVSFGAAVLSAQIEGNLANDVADAASLPVKIGGRAAASIAGHAAVTANDRVNAASDRRGRLIVALGGGNSWTKFNTTLAAPAVSFAIAAGANSVGRVSITLAQALDMYALVYDGLDATGTLVDRFFIPGASVAGTAVRDYTIEGGLAVTTGCFVALTTAAGAVTAPATGGYCHAIYQAG